jgi:hypothetical protein
MDRNPFPAIARLYWAVLRVLKSRCIRDFFLAAEFFLMIPLPAAVSIFFIISLSAAPASPESFLRISVTNFFALVLTELLTILFRSRLCSFCRCRFSAEVFLVAIITPAYLKSDGRRSVRLHFSHSATFLTFPFSKRAFILTSPPQELQKNFWVALVVREFLLAWAMFLSSINAAARTIIVKAEPGPASLPVLFR